MSEMMRAYLLGTLREEESSVIEEQYFLQPDYLARLLSEERTLIEAYLDGALLPVERTYFEERYLKTPALKRVVRRVTWERKRSWFRFAGVRLGAVAVLAAMLAVSVYLFRSARPEGPQSTPTARLSAQAGSVALRLTPGVRMGAAEESRSLALPNPDTHVSLIAELPGARSSTPCSARLSIVSADGSPQPVWRADPAPTRASDAGQELRLEIGPHVLVAGDYVLELTDPAGNVRSTYSFRVNTSR